MKQVQVEQEQVSWAEIHFVIAKGNEYRIKAGKLLTYKQASLPRGQFDSELDRENISRASAYRWILAFKRSIGEQSSHVETIQPSSPLNQPVTTPRQDEAFDPEPLGPQLKDTIDPLFHALGEVAKAMRKRPAVEVIAELRQQYDGGDGFDIQLQHELVSMRDWLDVLINGLQPLIVSCDTRST